MDKGRIIEQGPLEEVFLRSKNEHTRKFLSRIWEIYSITPKPWVSRE